MAKERSLTNEQLNKRFGNSFELVAYAIRYAERAIAAGRSLEDEQSGILNPAFHILQEIAEGRDLLEPISEKAKSEQLVSEQESVH